MGVERRHSHVKFSKTIRLGKNLDLDNAVAGEVEVGSLRDTGSFIERWNGTAWEVIGSLTPTLVELTFADTGITLTRPGNGKTIVDVDCTDGVVIINLHSMVKFDEIRIKKTDSSGNKLTYKGNGFNIDDLSERDISTQYNSDRLIGRTSQWGRY